MINKSHISKQCEGRFLCVSEILLQKFVSLKSVRHLLVCGAESTLSKTGLIHLTLKAKSTSSEIITNQDAAKFLSSKLRFQILNLHQEPWMARTQ